MHIFGFYEQEMEMKYVVLPSVGLAVFASQTTYATGDVWAMHNNAFEESSTALVVVRKLVPSNYVDIKIANLNAQIAEQKAKIAGIKQRLQETKDACQEILRTLQLRMREVAAEAEAFKYSALRDMNGFHFHYCIDLKTWTYNVPLPDGTTRCVPKWEDLSLKDVYDGWCSFQRWKHAKPELFYRGSWLHMEFDYLEYRLLCAQSAQQMEELYSEQKSLNQEMNNAKECYAISYKQLEEALQEKKRFEIRIREEQKARRARELQTLTSSHSDQYQGFQSTLNSKRNRGNASATFQSSQDRALQNHKQKVEQEQEPQILVSKIIANQYGSSHILSYIEREQLYAKQHRFLYVLKKGINSLSQFFFKFNIFSF